MGRAAAALGKRLSVTLKDAAYPSSKLRTAFFANQKSVDTL
jgi:hypothetical protein